MTHRYFILNKPANMVSQFKSTDNVPLLTDIPFPFPQGTHAIGRLDKDSEGLLLLTTDKAITRLIFSADKPHKRTYLVMLKNEMSEETFQNFSLGVRIKIKNGQEYIARPESVFRISDPVSIYPWSRDKRQIYPHTWLLIMLTEGKYRQVRKMTAAVKHKCLRLIRLKIEDIGIEGILPGTVKELDRDQFYCLAKLNK